MKKIIVLLCLLFSSNAYALDLGTSATSTNPLINNDPTSGFYSPSAKNIGIAIGSTEQVNIGSTSVQFTNGLSWSSVSSALATLNNIYGSAQYPVMNYGATCNGMNLSAVTTTSSSAVISDGVYSFTSADVGKLITIAGAGAAGAVLNTTILSVSGGSATLNTTAGTSIAGTGTATFGSNDTTAIQAAVNAANTAGGGLITLPATGHQCIINNTITWYSNIGMTGGGAGKSIIKWISATNMPGAAIQFTSGGTNSQYMDVQFSNFEMDGLAATVSSYGAQFKAIYSQYMTRPIMTGLYLHDWPATCLGIDYLYNAIIVGNIVQGCGRLAGSTTSVGASGIGVGTGYGNPADTGIIANNIAINNKAYGIFVETQSGSAVSSSTHVIANNQITMNNSSGRGIGDIGDYYAVITGNSILGTVGGTNSDGIAYRATAGGEEAPGVRFLITGNSIAYGNDGILLDYHTVGAGSTKGQISGNTISHSLVSGIYITTGSSSPQDSINIEGNQIYFSNADGIDVNGTDAVNYLRIADNDIYDNALTTGTTALKSGITLNVAVDSFDLTGNKFYDNQGSQTQLYGLSLNNIAVTDAQVVDNDFYHLGTGAIRFGSTGTLSGTYIANNNAYNTLFTSVTAGGTYNALATDTNICLNPTVSAVQTVDLPNPSPSVGQLIPAGQTMTVSDCKGIANTYNVTISPSSGNIDGSASYTISTNYGSWTGYWTGTIWKTVSHQ